MFGINPLMMTPLGEGASTWDPLKRSNMLLSGGNLTAQETGGGAFVLATSGKTSGKFYFEVIATNVDKSSGAGWYSYYIGIAPNGTPGNQFPGNNYVEGASYGDDGNIYASGGPFSGSGYATSNIISVAVDVGSKLVFFGKNGTWLSGGNPGAGTGGKTYSATGEIFPRFGQFAHSPSPGQATINLGASAFAYSPPSGFTAWG